MSDTDPTAPVHSTAEVVPSATVEDGRRGPVRGRFDARLGYGFMRAHRAEFSLAAMCRALRLSASGYYDWLKRASAAHHETGGTRHAGE